MNIMSPFINKTEEQMNLDILNLLNTIIKLNSDDLDCLTIPF